MVSSCTSPQQSGLLQRALQVAVHLNVAVAQIHAQLVEPLDQPGPVGAPQRLHTERGDWSSPRVALIPAARGADLPDKIQISRGGSKV